MLASAFVSSNEICAKILKKSPHISTIHLISADDLKLSIMLCRKVFVFVNPISSAKEIFCFIYYIEKKILHDIMRISICLYYNLTELIVMETDHSVLK